MSQQPSEQEHWLVRPATVRRLWLGFIVILALTVGAQFFFKIKGYFGLDGTFAFGAWFGFGSCLIMVLLAKILGLILKRDENYYVDSEQDLDADEERKSS